MWHAAEILLAICVLYSANMLFERFTEPNAMAKKRKPRMPIQSVDHLRSIGIGLWTLGVTCYVNTRYIGGRAWIFTSDQWEPILWDVAHSHEGPESVVSETTARILAGEIVKQFGPKLTKVQRFRRLSA